MHPAPWSLIALRVLSAPAIVVLAVAGASGPWLFAILLVAFLSDVFDGVVARRLAAATPMLRLADSVVDVVFYIAVAVVVVDPDVLGRHAVGLGVFAALRVSRLIVEFDKYRRIAAYHMWSAKTWGVLLLLGFAEVYLVGAGTTLFAMAVWMGVVTDAEGLAASLMLPDWHHDVPSVVHAWRLRQGSA
ncbi:MAG: CDP-alcohol phosphatidyltransferase family protein [Bacteroidota bacterium]